jgi:tRNA A37 methylthiotransferase MiaB
LGDRYIHNQIYVTHGVKIADQTPEMIELKRQQIMMKRTLKQLKEWRKEHESNHADVQREQRTDEEVNGRQRPAQP